MEIAEVTFDGVKKQYVLFAPLIKSFLVCPVLDRPVEYFCHEHGHRILEHVSPYAGKMVAQGYVPGCIKI